jgi:hypothetical protein
VNPDRSRYAAGVFLLSAIGVGCAILIVIGELLGGPDRRIFWSIGGAALGGIFVVYGVILVLLRKMGMIGPRRAER